MVVRGRDSGHLRVPMQHRVIDERTLQSDVGRAREYGYGERLNGLITAAERGKIYTGDKQTPETRDSV